MSQTEVTSPPPVSLSFVTPTEVAKLSHKATEATDHPQGDAIRGQVEYYFSDKNLPTDRHLLEKCGGSQNLPVKLKSICGWSKMRQYKPYTAVVEALKRSKKLEVLPDNTIRRRVPYIGPTVLDHRQEDVEAYIDNGSWEEVTPREEKPRDPSRMTYLPRSDNTPKQHQQRPKEYRKALIDKKMTGFEEYYADAPVTPAEFQEEQEIYGADIDFPNRIEIAIQRYVARRKFKQEHQQLFEAWMHFGGIETGPRQFTGKIAPEDLEGKDGFEKAKILATHFVGDDKDDDSKWAVDFVGVAKGFLSSWFTLNKSGYDDEQVDAATRVMTNFYNYLIHHNVCPEYNDDLLEARRICAQAKTELIRVRDVGYALPGDFNVACSTLCGLHYKGVFAADQSWAGDEGASKLFDWAKNAGLRDESARIIINTAFTALGTDEQFEVISALLGGAGAGGMLKVDSRKRIGLEVTAVHHATEDTFGMYNDLNEGFKNKIYLRPLGKLICRPWTIPDYEPLDLPAHVKLDLNTDIKVFEFWIEDDVLRHCFQGMKMEAWIAKLERFDTWFIDTHEAVHCSFYEYLPNELVWARKKRDALWAAVKRTGEAYDGEDRFLSVAQGKVGGALPAIEEGDGLDDDSDS